MWKQIQLETKVEVSEVTGLFMKLNYLSSQSGLIFDTVDPFRF